MKYEGRSYQWRQVLAHLGLVGSFKERPSGNYVGSCLFHNNEKTPSLKLYSQTMTFICYGCAARGEVTDFVQMHKGYKDAIPEDMRELQDFFAKLT